MGYFVEPTFRKPAINGYNSSESFYTELSSFDSFTGLPYNTDYVKFGNNYHIRFHFKNHSGVFKYLVLDQNRNPVVGSSQIRPDARQVLNILKGHIHPALHQSLLFTVDETTGFARLQLPDHRVDQDSVQVGRMRIKGLEFKPGIPDDPFKKSSLHGTVRLISSQE